MPVWCQHCNTLICPHCRCANVFKPWGEIRTDPEVVSGRLLPGVSCTGWPKHSAATPTTYFFLIICSPIQSCSTLRCMSGSSINSMLPASIFFVVLNLMIYAKWIPFGRVIASDLSVCMLPAHGHVTCSAPISKSPDRISSVSTAEMARFIQPYDKMWPN